MVLGRIETVPRGLARVFALTFVRFKGFLYPPAFRRILELEDASASGTHSRNQLAADVLVNDVHLVPGHILRLAQGLDVIQTWNQSAISKAATSSQSSGGKGTPQMFLRLLQFDTAVQRILRIDVNNPSSHLSQWLFTLMYIKLAPQVLLRSHGVTRQRGWCEELALAPGAGSHRGNLALVPDDDEAAILKSYITCSC